MTLFTSIPVANNQKSPLPSMALKDSFVTLIARGNSFCDVYVTIGMFNMGFELEHREYKDEADPKKGNRPVQCFRYYG